MLKVIIRTNYLYQLNKIYIDWKNRRGGIKHLLSMAGVLYRSYNSLIINDDSMFYFENYVENAANKHVIYMPWKD